MSRALRVRLLFLLSPTPHQLSLKDAIQQTRHETRQDAKRQITWFRKEPGVEWLPGFGEEKSVQAQAAELLSK